MKLDYSKIYGILKGVGVRLEKPENGFSHLMPPAKFSDNMKDLMDLYSEDRSSSQFLFFQKHLKSSQDFMGTMPYDNRHHLQESHDTLYKFLDDMKESNINFQIDNFQSLNLFVSFFHDIASNLTHKKLENEFTKAVGLKDVKKFFSDNIKAEQYSPKRIMFPKIMMICLAETLDSKEVLDELKEAFLKRMVGCSRAQVVFNPANFCEPAIPFLMDFYKQKGMPESKIKREVLDVAIHKTLTTPKEKMKIDTIIVNTFEKWGYVPDDGPKVGIPDYISSTFTWNVKVSTEVFVGRGLNGVGNDKLHNTVFMFLRSEAEKLGCSIKETSPNFNLSLSCDDFDKFVEVVPKFKAVLEDFDTVIVPFMVDKIKNGKLDAAELAPLTASYYETFMAKNKLDAVITSAIKADNTSNQSSRDFKL